RYRATPPFCGSVIRRFHRNASAMKKIAARDFEDLLQCAIPAFEGLFPDTQHDNAVQDLLFNLAEWHATAKLRLQTDSTFEVLQQCTRDLGSRLRSFVKNICPSYDTKELPREEAACKRRNAKKATIGQAASETIQASTSRSNLNSGPKQRTLNLITSKLHVLGDYVSQIILFGTTDSYSTQAVSSHL
ncbi:hypothetical protein K474DRAFT_1573265, partial [Panus rudis PR-1116 ss-1]